MKRISWLTVSLIGFTLTSGALAQSTPPTAAPRPPSPLISAEPVGAATLATIDAGLQQHLAVLGQTDTARQSAIEDLFHWVYYVLRNIIHYVQGVDYVKINYQTTTAAGGAIPVTGLAILPRSTLEMPILSMQHPTEIQRKFSPSMFNATNLWDDEQYNVVIGSLYALGGYIVVLPDYPGMGSNTNAHPYCTVSIANSVVDLIRSVRDHVATNNGVKWSGRLYLQGYSEGGYATIVTARDIQERYTNEFTVSAVAGLDGPYSLSDTMRRLMLTANAGFPAPYFLPYVVNGYDSVYGAQTPTFLFTNAVKSSVPGETNFAVRLQQMALAGTNTPDEMNTLMRKATPFTGPCSILTDAYVAGLSNTASEICQVLASNNAYATWTPRMPMRLYHNPDDDCVPYGNTTNALGTFLRAGAKTVSQVTFGDKWYHLDYWIIKNLLPSMGTYHVASAPFAYVYSFLWIDNLAYGPRTIKTPGDIDGDSQSDLAAYNETTGLWQVLLSNNARAADRSAMQQVTFFMGGPGYTAVLADFDGNGLADPAVFHAASGAWIVMLAVLDYAPVTFALGGPGCVPVPQDYDGDRVADPAVYRAQDGNWLAFLSESDALVSATFGGSGFAAVRGDYDGDLMANPAVYREQDGAWEIDTATNGVRTATLGGSGYTPVPGDYDGDGLSDLVLFNPSLGLWMARLSTGGADITFALGGSGATAVAADLDGDGKADPTVYYAATATWVARLSGSGYTAATYTGFGGPGFVPVY